VRVGAGQESSTADSVTVACSAVTAFGYWTQAHDRRSGVGRGAFAGGADCGFAVGQGPVKIRAKFIRSNAIDDLHFFGAPVFAEKRARNRFHVRNDFVSGDPSGLTVPRRISIAGASARRFTSDGFCRQVTVSWTASPTCCTARSVTGNGNGGERRSGFAGCAATSNQQE